MIELKNVSFAYNGGDQLALDGVTLSVEQGERVALCGSNGSGKSTVASILNGSLLPTSGNVLVDGVTITDSLELAHIVGIVRQDPLSQIVGMTVEEEVAFGPRCLRLPRTEVIARTREALDACGLSSMATMSVHALSGGQQQLLALASALAMKPRYLILDEVTSHLDEQAAHTLQAIVKAQLAAGVGVLSITHDPQEVARADRVVTLVAGRVARSPQPVAPEAPVTTHTRPAVPKPPVLSLKHVEVRYDNTVALHDFDFEVAPGELVLVCGPCGAGKSTATQVMAGVLKPTRGTVTLNGAPVQPGTVGYVPQRVEDQLFANTVLDDVAFGPRNLGMPEDEAQRRAHAALAKAGVPEEYADSSPLALSGGMRRRVAFAGVLALEPRVYVLDEPTAGLDPAGRAALCSVMEELRAEGAAFVVVTHELAAWETLATRSVNMLAPTQPAETLNSAPAAPHVDARIKYAGLLLITLALFSAHSVRGVVLAFAAMLALAAWSRVALCNLGKALVPTALILTLMVLGSAIVLDGTGDLQLVGSMGISLSGSVRAAVSVCRVAALVGYVVVAQATTSLPETAAACVWFLRPLGAFGLPVDALSTVTSIALRMIPETIDEFQGISRAQTARGANFASGSVVQRLRRYAAVVVPLVVRLFARSDDLARSLRDRCYEGDLTNMQQGLDTRDMLAILGVLGISLAVLLA